LINVSDEVNIENPDASLGPRVSPLWGDSGGDETLAAKPPLLRRLPSPCCRQRRPPESDEVNIHNTNYLKY
jgi:hypothetical protein